MGKHYVYILTSNSDPTKIYVGYTEDIRRRLNEHNMGTQMYTRRYAPWRLQMYLVFQERKNATDFEKYLKTSSGKAFIKKHFI